MRPTNDTDAAARYSLVRDVAARLGKNPLFAGGGNAVCRLYANVPLKDCELDGVPLEYSAGDLGDYVPNNRVIDLLVCRTGNSEDSLAIIFEPSEMKLVLAEYSVAHLLIHLGQTPEDILKFIERQINEWLFSQFDEPSFLSRTTLRTLPAEDVAGETGDALRARLTRARLLLDDGSVTTYGRETGLLEQFYSDDSGLGYRGWAVVQDGADFLKEALSPGRDALSGKIPLEKRLDWLERGYPCDEKYAAFLAESLRSLLETPLEFLCGGVPQVSATLEDELTAAQSLLKRGGGRPVRTYADALGLVRDLYRRYWQSELGHTEKAGQGDTILVILAKLLVSPPTPQLVREQDAGPRSLKDRLSDLGAGPGETYPILSVPVAHYYYAASILDESNYPIWLLKYRFEIRTGNKFRISMAHMLKWYLGEAPGRKSDDILTHLYDLLVEPIFPNLDPRTR